MNLGKYDFSCSINTDGVSIFKSSKLSIWPILLSVNELSYSTRRRFTVLGGLWFGATKPTFDAFLGPLVSQCNNLSATGLEWKANKKTMNSKVFFPIVAADSVARCCLQGIKQFNGEYGCPWCIIKGENLTMEGNSRKWIYHPKLQREEPIHSLLVT
ncbi:hypothetical protein Ocin01_15981 [Orchesella cincta]|uniref:Uncharacterized protein n=1 Tax=Orchesella cincta TaxID=48709 RepID=A0A1D2MCJ6_ORCCI|nr:hypothetical protein Ocin01_15981 [Orchesella cincta]